MSEWQHVSYPQRIVFGPGTVRDLRNLVKTLDARQVMLITSPGRSGSEEGETVRRALGRHLVSTFAGVEQHVPAPAVQQCVLQARRDGVDAVVSFGGGSCADLAKAVCFFVEQELGTPGASYADHPALPHISVPTTYSGAELTPFFAMTDPHTRQKTGSTGPTLTPRGTIYDAALTLTVSARLTAETGMNALAHCVEVTWSTSSSAEARVLAASALSRIRSSLPAVFENPRDLDYRVALQEGAFLAARALQNAVVGAHHGLSQLVGARAGIAHGLASAVLLPHVIHYNASETPEAIDSLGEMLERPGDPASAVQDLNEALGLPVSLSECGASAEDLEAVARLSQSNPSVRSNPKPVSEADALAILESAF